MRIEKLLPYLIEDPIAPGSVLSMGEVAEKIKLPDDPGDSRHRRRVG
jgi:hypothetical protein